MEGGCRDDIPLLLFQPSAVRELRERVVNVGANLCVRPFFVWCRVCPNANFANGRESTQITVFVIPNTSSCHSEHSEESRPGKEKIHRFALNDKLMVNCQLLIVMPVIRTQRDIPPAPPSKGGRAKAKGDVIPLKGGNAGAEC